MSASKESMAWLPLETEHSHLIADHCSCPASTQSVLGGAILRIFQLNIDATSPNCEKNAPKMCLEALSDVIKRNFIFCVFFQCY